MEGEYKDDIGFGAWVIFFFLCSKIVYWNFGVNLPFAYFITIGKVAASLIMFIIYKWVKLKVSRFKILLWPFKIIEFPFRTLKSWWGSLVDLIINDTPGTYIDDKKKK